MFGYKCQECGRGTVQTATVKDPQTKFGGEPFTVLDAVMGMCDACGVRHFNAKERKGGRQLFTELIRNA